MPNSNFCESQFSTEGSVSKGGSPRERSNDKVGVGGKEGSSGIEREIQLDSEEISQKLQQRGRRALLSAPRNTHRTRARSQTAGYPIRGLDHEAREVVYPKEPPLGVLGINREFTQCHNFKASYESYRFVAHAGAGVHLLRPVDGNCLW